jgi:hypothetical protein
MVEVLLAIGFLIIFFNIATFFYYEGRKSCIKYLDKASYAKSVNTVAKCWRNFVHANPKPLNIKQDRIDFANSNSVSLNKNLLIFARGENRRVFALPEGFTASFKLENNTGEPPLLVLYLKTQGTKKQVLEDKFIRIAAVSGGKDES